MSDNINVSTLAAVLASFTGMFFRGAKASYDAASAHKDKLYFATDTHELLVNGVSYGGGGIANVTLEGDTLKFEMTDGTEKTVSVADLLKYNSAMSDSLATVEDFGGIPAGTTVAQLKAKTISQVLDDLIFPTVQPTKKDPSASLILKSGFSNNGVYEVGAAAPQDPANFTKSSSRGAINIAGKKTQDYAGEVTAQVLYYGSSESNTTLPTEIPEGETAYHYKVTFAAGPQPLDSKGGNATSISKYNGGSATGDAKINGVYPYYGSTGANNALVKLALTTASEFTFTAPTEVGSTERHGFKLPAKYTVTEVQWYNNLGGEWVTLPLSNFTETTANETVQGKQVSYKTYRRNEASRSGDTQFKVKFNKK